MPQECQVVLVAAPAFELPGPGQQGAGRAEQVQRDVQQRNILLELRRTGRPLAQPLAEHERVVAEPERVGSDIVVDQRLGHRWVSPSGTS